MKKWSVDLSVYKKYFDVYSSWGLKKFKNIHHKYYIGVRETELLTTDEHVESYTKLVDDPNWNLDLFIDLEVICEDQHILLTRWQDKHNVVAITALIKEELCWRSVVVKNI